MKEIKPTRFQKVAPAEINDFEAEEINDKRPAPAPQRQEPPPVQNPETKRTSVRTPQTIYHIFIPLKRVRIRHAFEIHADQLEGFKKIQAAHRDIHGNSGAPSLSDLAREAFDTFIKERVKGQKNIDISHE